MKNICYAFYLIDVIKNDLSQMTMFNRYSFLLFFLLSLAAINTGCNDECTPQEYLQWVNKMDGNLTIGKEIPEIAMVKVKYLPSELIILNELQREILEEDSVLARKEELNGLIYFLVRFSAKNKEYNITELGVKNDIELAHRIAYMSYDMQQDFKLISLTDTLKPAIFHFERNYALAPHIDFLIAFESKMDKYQDDIVFLYQDQLFRSGKLKFLFNKEFFAEIPKLKSYNL